VHIINNFICDTVTNVVISDIDRQKSELYQVLPTNNSLGKIKICIYISHTVTVEMDHDKNKFRMFLGFNEFGTDLRFNNMVTFSNDF
jgi:hypothetical protein